MLHDNVYYDLASNLLISSYETILIVPVNYFQHI